MRDKWDNFFYNKKLRRNAGVSLALCHKANQKAVEILNLAH
jgi:hypothetical protein